MVVVILVVMVVVVVVVLIVMVVVVVVCVVVHVCQQAFIETKGQLSGVGSLPSTWFLELELSLLSL